MDPLLSSAVVSGAVDHRCRPARREHTGRWPAVRFVIAAEVGERFALFGITANLITYLTGQLQLPTAEAAAALNAWSGACCLLPLPCSMLADRWVGRYRTIVCGYCLYIVAAMMLVISAASGPRLPPELHLTFFFAALCALAVAQAGTRACLPAFGGDQFDPSDAGEAQSRSSFFNWNFFAFSGAVTVAMLVMSYVQDNVGWVVGFAAPSITLLPSLAVFLLGTKSYRYYLPSSSSSVTAVTNACSAETTGDGVEAVLGLLPIGLSCTMYAVCFAQFATTFTKGAATLDRRIGPAFQVPPASLQCVPSVSAVVFLPLYDRLLVQLAGKMSSRLPGITVLQRIGAGLLMGIAGMVMASLVEMRRLSMAREAGLVASPELTIPMSLWWLLPHYIIFGVSQALALTGIQEFFYSEMPSSLRSVGMAMGLVIMAGGSFFSSFLICTVDKLSRLLGGRSWFDDNINIAHLDYFYLLLAALSAAFFLLFAFFSGCYVHRSPANISARVIAESKTGDLD